MRCSVHSGQRALEKALATDPDVQVLVKSWVPGFSDGSGKNPGGFCRAVRNSQKLQRLTAEKQLEVLDESLRRVSHFGFAPQRFNTVCDACVNVSENIEAVCNVLSHLAAVDDQLSGHSTDPECAPCISPCGCRGLGLPMSLSLMSEVGPQSFYKNVFSRRGSSNWA